MIFWGIVSVLIVLGFVELTTFLRDWSRMRKDKREWGNRKL